MESRYKKERLLKGIKKGCPAVVDTVISVKIWVAPGISILIAYYFATLKLLPLFFKVPTGNWQVVVFFFLICLNIYEDILSTTPPIIIRFNVYISNKILQNTTNS